ncbi:MAG: hypothetical protein FJ279_06950 [Planctomycetes bacterium]|nr:hypothetical protein [Planctomycetota bacterium]MBM4085240.1 hypothetical protein [Planctomycetota bacterium]
MNRADRLSDFYRTLKPQPLLESPEFEAFYRAELNAVRGTDKVALMKLGLERAHGGSPYKALLMGHSGVGKSTEVTRLTREIASRYRAIRFSVATDLDPVSFQPFDVLLLMIAEIAERTARPVAEGGSGRKPSDEPLRQVWDWFGAEEEVVKRATQVSAEIAAGAGLPADSWWAKALGLFASVKGEMKYASVREKKTVTYRLSRLSDLIAAANKLIQQCNQALRQETGHEWLFVGEDFDKAGVSPKQVEEFFLSYSNALQELDAHLVFNIPVALGYSERAAQLPVAPNLIITIPDTMVFRPDHSPSPEGRTAIQAVLEARVNPARFAPGQMERLIVASGGNLRDLFSLTNAAADLAILRGEPAEGQVKTEDADRAIAELRSDYERRLGQSSFDLEVTVGPKKEPITYEMKADRLLRIYRQEPTAKIPDPVLHSLLRARAVQEFNAERWFGVHPLVVDILASQGKIKRPKQGPVPGGTQ